MLRRNIPLNYRNVTGVASSYGAGEPTEFESTLEHDFIRLLRFDDAHVARYRSQPVIQYVDQEGRNRRYTPDFIVEYHSGSTVIYEVKHRKDIKSNWAELKPKFKQGIRYAKSNGWHFRLISEVEIRTDYLKNVQFLERYKFNSSYDPRFEQLLNNLKAFETSTPDELIASVAHGKTTKAELLYTLWQLVADNLIGIDLDIPINMKSEIWCKSEETLYD